MQCLGACATVTDECKAASVYNARAHHALGVAYGMIASKQSSPEQQSTLHKQALAEFHKALDIGGVHAQYDHKLLHHLAYEYAVVRDVCGVKHASQNATKPRLTSVVTLLGRRVDSQSSALCTTRRRCQSLRSEIICTVSSGLYMRKGMASHQQQVYLLHHCSLALCKIHLSAI
jgi:hypothetical protein